MIEIKHLRELVKLMVNNDLTEVDLESENEHIKIKRGQGASAAPVVTHVAQPAAAAPAQPAAAPAAAPQATPAEASAPKDEGNVIASPMVGTFYSASSPDAKPYVSAGDKVSADTVVCIIEAMKVFNEIKAETTGTITEVLVKNGDSVEFGQPLFRIKP